MENRSRIEAGVPEVLIQHIQSFLDGKEAAQTSVLSKSWYSAWSTRPNLDFDQRHFRIQNHPFYNFKCYWYNLIGKCYFWEFAKKTMQRYEALNLRIESFRLVGLFWLGCDFCLVKELIVKAIRMGAVDFDFQLIKLIYSCETFTLPHEVLESETLNRLSVHGCKIDVRPDGKVCCGKLKSLFLNSVELKYDEICGLISSCPLVENLTLKSINVHPYVAGELVSRNLKSLFLADVHVDTLFLKELSANFPCLKDLTLDGCRQVYNRRIKLSSSSLECISIKQNDGVFRATFDVPSLRNFKFSGSKVPSLNFIKPSREWESGISFRYDVSDPDLFDLVKNFTNPHYLL